MLTRYRLDDLCVRACRSMRCSSRVLKATRSERDTFLDVLGGSVGKGIRNGAQASGTHFELCKCDFGACRLFLISSDIIIRRSPLNILFFGLSKRRSHTLAKFRERLLRVRRVLSLLASIICAFFTRWEGGVFRLRCQGVVVGLDSSASFV